MLIILQEAVKRAAEKEEEFHKLDSDDIPYASYGRGIEQASGLGLWFISYTLISSTLYQGIELLEVYTFFWGWAALILGFCQLAYHKVTQRSVFSIVASAIWFSMAFYSYGEHGDWNIATAACIPFGLFNFYIYGFVTEVWIKNKDNPRYNKKD